ncbi:hypothetical protein BRX37_14065 [Sphingomonas sp. S-NIH.Pt3_0716]|nr:hypothetical protein BRX37_14065 [Sphingomonas sp. S-NIH.Pt3_0716]
MNRDDHRRYERNQADDLHKVVAGGFAIRIGCKRCKTERIIEAKPLLALFVARRWETNLIAASNRLRCRSCGAKWGWMEAHIGGADSPSIGPTTDEEYKRLLARLRR